MIGDGYKLRIFYEDTDDEEFVWHMDKKDREIEVIAGEKWQLQLDDKYPCELVPGSLYNIPKMVYHRVIKGKGNLKIKIREGE